MELPLFPLATVLYPGLPIPLHVFEDRYRQMFARILEGERRFGVVAIALGQEVGGPAAFQPVGCVAEVREVRPYPDGRLDVVAHGTARFRVEAVVQASPFIVAEVSTIEEPTGEAGEAARLAERAGYLLARYLRLLLELVGEPAREPELPGDPVAASYLIAATLQVDLHEKQRLLAIPSAAERLRAETALLLREVALLERLREQGGPAMVGPFSLN